MKPHPAIAKVRSSRILSLDYLRGFFIIIIISDHLWRWPNIFEFISGRGELWASAAEGFVIISGLLVGYIRGYKEREKPLGVVTKKLISRGILLYVWMIITTFVLVGVSWLFNFQGSIAYVPIAQYHWSDLALSVLRLDYVHTLTHFLYLYALFLVLAPGVIWLLRHGKAWLAGIFSLALWIAGVHYSLEWMQWQILFFLPVIAGFYLEDLLRLWRKVPAATRRICYLACAGLTLITVIIAQIQILPYEPGSYTNSLFGRDPVTLGTIIISFVWFTGLLSLTQLLLPILKRWLGWLLLTFGERSLTAYILHSIPLILCSLLFAEADNFWFNSLLAGICIMFTWGLLKIPHINRIIPR